MSNDAAILGRAIRAVTDECRYCRCHGDSCSIGGGEKCCWVDELKTLCNHPACLQKDANFKRKFNRQKGRKVRLVKGRVA